MTKSPADQNQTKAYWEKLQPRELFYGTMLTLALALIFYGAFYFRATLGIVFLGLLIGTATRPLADRMRGAGLRRDLTIAGFYVLMLVGLVALGVAALPWLLDAGADVLDRAAEFYLLSRQRLSLSPNVLISTFSQNLPESFLPTEGSAASEASPLTHIRPVTLLTGSLKLLVMATGSLLIGFYWSLEGEKAERLLNLSLPRHLRPRARQIGAEMASRVGLYLRGQVLISAIVGTSMLFVYLILGLPHALGLALLVALLEWVPIVGPPLAILPAALLALSNSPTSAVIVVIASLAIHALEQTLLVPRVMRRFADLNPILTFLALIGMGALLGPVGVIIAVPAAVVAQSLVTQLWGTTSTTSSGADTPLQYELIQLSEDARDAARSAPSEAEFAHEEIELLALWLARRLQAPSEGGRGE